MQDSYLFRVIFLYDIQVALKKYYFFYFNVNKWKTVLPRGKKKEFPLRRETFEGWAES